MLARGAAAAGAAAGELTLKLALILAALALLGCEPAASWATVHEGLDEGLVSVWGRSSSDVYVVGSDAGAGPLVLHFDGAGWTRLHTGERGDLWWVNGAAGGPIFMGGEGGLIVRFDGSSFTTMATPGTGTVFGIWAAAPDDAWAVGGVGASSGFVWRYDGSAWTAMDVPELGDRGLFKVWGNAPDDVWMVGAAGAAYHWDGSALTPVAVGTTRTLFTVHTEGDRVVAVGGAGNAALVEREGAAFVDRSPMFTSQLFGVWLTPGDGGFAVGLNGAILRRGPDGWTSETEDFAFVPGLHAVWVDEVGGVWAVGGQVISEPLSDGVVIHRGVTVPSGEIEEGS